MTWTAIDSVSRLYLTFLESKKRTLVLRLNFLEILTDA